MTIKSRKSRKSRKSKAKTLLPKPKPGGLGNYSTKQPAATRRQKLAREVKKHGYKTTVLDLNLRATVNKRQAPEASKKMKQDIQYLRKHRTSRKSRKSRR
ncbi:Hypothetical protein PACV_268 [Pacmanvirus A23]|uniref:Hypothetical protein n=1 Tax=Pacmanvirus A23 TaxID=1932881 RepID=UPI000A095D58|nr:Hypothetical protein B9W72_gp265 [Pacmanvirus A23]SIP85982.1 Hypothetical protein PACV_268 [Pacmanvirus A23]